MLERWKLDERAAIDVNIAGNIVRVLRPRR